MKRKVILLIASYPDSIIKFRGALIDSMIQLGMLVHVAVPDLSEEDEVYQELITRGVNVHPLNMDRTGTNPISDLKLLYELFSLIKKTRPDLVLSYTIKPVVYGLISSWLARVPKRYALVTGLGHVFIERGTRVSFIKSIIKKLYKFSLSKASKVFFQNPDDELLFRDSGILPENIASYIINGSGVDVTEYSVTPIPDSPAFLLIARLLYTKGVREYAQAAKLVKEKYPDVRFDLVGWIDNNPDSINKSELDEWQKGNVLNYLGKLEDVRPAISNCSVFVLPSYREGTPRTVLEAMSMGRAIITTDAPGCKETVMDQVNGYLVPVGSVIELKNAMIRYIENPELVNSMGSSSREYVERKFNVLSVNQNLLSEMEVI